MNRAWGGAFLLLLVLWAWLPPHVRAEAQIRLGPGVLVRGDLVLVEIVAPRDATPPLVRFAEKPIPVFWNADAYRGLVGADLDIEPGVYPLTVEINGEPRLRPVLVADRDYGVRNLTLPPSMTEFDEETRQRITRERNMVAALWEESSGERLWDGPFIRPVAGEVTGGFGRRTIVNGEPRSPHSGVDLRAEMNENIVCSNSGRVALVADLFFSGQ